MTLWAAHKLKEQGIQTGNLNLAPFVEASIGMIRSEDGIGIACLVPESNETVSVAFAFETGEVWSIDTSLLSHDGVNIFIAATENIYTDRLYRYARFLFGLGITPPYQWISGLSGVNGRRLQIPPPPNQMRVPGWPGPQCLSDIIQAQGTYDGNQTPSNALYPFFREIFGKCGVPRPDYMPR